MGPRDGAVRRQVGLKNQVGQRTVHKSCKEFFVINPYYYVLLNEARKRTQESLNRRLIKSGNIKRWNKLTLASAYSGQPANAIEFAQNEWPKYYGEDTHQGFTQSWEAIILKSLNDPDHFNLAIWQEVDGEQVLVALAVGAPSNRRTYMTLKWIERYYGHNYLKGRALWPILTCAEEYARLLGSEKVLIKDPVDPAKYERYGYTPFTHPNVAFGGKYLGKDVT